jgi:RNA polymerase primary sigma factor
MFNSLTVHEVEEGIPSYLAKLAQVPLLTSQQEEELTQRVREGDTSARKRLVESNMRLVINIAKSYRNKSVPFEDLIQEGAIGLMQAAERFDPSRGFRFSTYATHWVRQAIGRAIDNKSKAIRLPAHVSQAMRRVERERVRLSAMLGREPTLDQLADACRMSPTKLQRLMESAQEMISLDMKVGESGSTTLGGLIRDERSPSPETLVLTDEAKHELRRIFLELTERERQVMELRFNFNDVNAVTGQDEVARQMCISRERVRQIEIQALKKLRLMAHQRSLREILAFISNEK